MPLAPTFVHRLKLGPGSLLRYAVLLGIGVGVVACAASSHRARVHEHAADRSQSRERFTPPGTRLRIGQRAIVPYVPLGEVPGQTAPYVLRVAVLAITAAPSEVPGAVGGGTAYFVKFAVSNLGPRSLAASKDQAFPILRNTGKTILSETFGAPSTSACSESPPPRRLAVGKTWTGCSSQSVTGELLGARYTGWVPDYSANPVVWNATPR